MGSIASRLGDFDVRGSACLWVATVTPGGRRLGIVQFVVVSEEDSGGEGNEGCGVAVFSGCSESADDAFLKILFCLAGECPAFVFFLPVKVARGAIPRGGVESSGEAAIHFGVETELGGFEKLSQKEHAWAGGRNGFSDRVESLAEFGAVEGEEI